MADIKKHAIRSVSITLSAQALKFFLGLAVTMILARLLTPNDYGVVAMVGVITGFVGVFRDGGLSIATIQCAEITEPQISTLFWINVALGSVTALILAVSSPIVAWFFHDNSLLWIVLALAIPFVLSGLTAQPQALLQRQMRFKTIAAIEIASLVISASSGVIAAAAEWGPWALVTMTIAMSASNTALVFALCRWRPGQPVRGSGVRSLLRFGGVLTANRLLDSLACSTDVLLLGKFFSADMVGLYSRAQTLMLQPLTQVMPPLQNVALPVMSRLAEKPETLRRVFLDLLRLTAFASSFITAYIVVCAESLIHLFLGPKWMAASTILRLLGGSAFFLPLSTLCVLNLTAQGSRRLLTRWGLLKNVIIVVAMLSGIAWGAQGIAGALSVFSVCILLPLLIHITSRAGPASLKELWRASGPGFVFCAIGTCGLALIRHHLRLDHGLVGLGVLFVINLFLHTAAIAAMPSFRRSLLRVLG